MRSTTSRALAIAAALLVTAACEADEARVSFTVFPVTGRFEPGMVTIRFTDGGRTRTVSGNDFEGDDQRGDTGEFETRTHGSLEVDVTVTAGGDSVASGSLELPLDPDWRWNVSLFLSERNPYDACIGCFGYRSFSIVESYRSSPAESLWMIWGGNSISHPDVY